MNLTNFIQELEQKRTDLASQLHKVDEALKALRAVDSLFTTDLAKTLVKRKTATKETYNLEVPHPRDFAKSYIRNMGKEVSISELFSAYEKLTRAKHHTKRETTMAYNRFQANFSYDSCKRHGFVRQLYKIDGIGRQAYLNVASASELVKSPNAALSPLEIVNVELKK